MGEHNEATETKDVEHDAAMDLKAHESVRAGDAMLTEGRGGETQRGLKSRHIQFL